MALLSVIRRWRLRDGMAIREIARRTGLSRNTIKKYLSSGALNARVVLAVEPHAESLVLALGIAAVAFCSKPGLDRGEWTGVNLLSAVLVGLPFRRFNRSWNQLPGHRIL